MSAHKPATPLSVGSSSSNRFSIYDNGGNCIAEGKGLDAVRSIVNAANAYPKLIAALRELCEVVEYARTHDLRPTSVESIKARALLRELGEAE